MDGVARGRRCAILEQPVSTACAREDAQLPWVVCLLSGVEYLRRLGRRIWQ